MDNEEFVRGIGGQQTTCPSCSGTGTDWRGRQCAYCGGTGMLSGHSSVRSLRSTLAAALAMAVAGLVLLMLFFLLVAHA